MLRTIRIWTAALMFAVTAGGSLFAVAAPQTAAAAKCEDTYFLTIPAWYNGLITADKSGNCNISQPGTGEAGLNQFIWKIVLNITEIMLHLVGYLTAGFIIYGGFRYMLAAGSADGMSKAKTTIVNAVIGLTLSILSIAIVKIVSGAL